MLPRWFTNELSGRALSAEERSPNERPRIALIGCGGRGSGVAKDAQRFGDVVAVCDADARHLGRAGEAFAGAKAFDDFRAVCDQPGVDVVMRTWL